MAGCDRFLSVDGKEHALRAGWSKYGESFTLRPGDVLLAEDHTGSGHKWRLINDEPWNALTSSLEKVRIPSSCQMERSGSCPLSNKHLKKKR
jgi:hypothetical protein